MNSTTPPQIIQGGMGVGVSSWRLARAVALRGCLGVVSGTALAVILARRLQLGDPGGHLRRAADRFPIPGVAERVFDLYFNPEGKARDRTFRPSAMPSQHLGRALTELTVLANFIEVDLAKEAHGGAIGINFLEKIQFPTLPSLFGAMLAQVDYVLMGAGIPRAIPGILDGFAQGKPARLKLDVEDALPGEDFESQFDPVEFCGGSAPALERPKFLAIISSATLALALARKSTGRVDGFVVEGATAGGHNAPPRGPLQLSARGEPVYGPRDTPDLEKICDLGLPFWLAGSYADPEKIIEARSLGAAGVQVGTPFAFCEESGIDPVLKQSVIDRSLAEGNRVFTDPLASPTGFPFKVLELEQTMSEAAVYARRKRICDLGYLRRAFRRSDGSLGYRCPAEPAADYERKGGNPADLAGRKCVCNGLLSTMGLGQILGGGQHEVALMTAGDDVARLGRFVRAGHRSYTAGEVVDYLLGRKKPERVTEPTLGRAAGCACEPALG